VVAFVYLLLLGFELPYLFVVTFDRLCEKETAESKTKIAPPCPDCLCVVALRAQFSLFRLFAVVVGVLLMVVVVVVGRGVLKWKHRLMC